MNISLRHNYQLFGLNNNQLKSFNLFWILLWNYQRHLECVIYTCKVHVAEEKVSKHNLNQLLFATSLFRETLKKIWFSTTNFHNQAFYLFVCYYIKPYGKESWRREILVFATRWGSYRENYLQANKSWFTVFHAFR